MAEFGLIAPPLRGHLDPMIALGLALAARGHGVTLFSDAPAPPPLPIRFAPVSTRHGAGGLEARMAAVTGLRGLSATIAAMAERAADLCGALPAAIRTAGVEVLLVDQTEPAGALAALQCGLPFASIGAALPLNREDGVPPPYLGWRHHPDGRRDWLNRGGYRVVDWMMRPLTAVLRARANAVGITGVNRLEDLLSPHLQLLQCVAGFDYPRRALPAHVRYLGPFRAPEQPDAATVDALPDDGRPLVFCTLGSIQGHRAEIFEAAALAAAERGMRLLAATGGKLAIARKQRLEALPGAPVIRDFVAQRLVLARAHAAIMHGGFNSMLDALGCGVPVVAVPLAFEQGAIAARLASCGAGAVVSPRAVRRELGPALDRLEACRPAAARLAGEIAGAGGAGLAARLLERLAEAAPFRRRQPGSILGSM